MLEKRPSLLSLWGFGEFRGGPSGLAFEAIGRGEPGVDARM
jgi:hypothetical protein